MGHNAKAYRNLRFLIEKALFVIAIAVYFTACGGSDGDAQNSGPYTCQKLAGTYLEHPFGFETMTLNSDCTVTDSYCGYDATVEFTDSTSGNLIFTVIGTNGAPGCMASISHECRSEVDGTLFGVDCGAPHQYLWSRIL